MKTPGKKCLTLERPEVNPLEDQGIISLFLKRSENAIAETKQKYGRLLMKIAYGVLGSKEDAEECLSDTYLKLWNSIPPANPISFTAYAGTIIRNSALDKLRMRNKSGNTGTTLPLDELYECIECSGGLDSYVDESELSGYLNRFLGSLSSEERILFLRRYWYGFSVNEIVVQTGMNENRVYYLLTKTRSALKEYLEREGKSDG